MDPNRFDTLTRSLTAASSRRSALGALVGSTLGLLGLAETEAGKGKGKKGGKGKGKKKKKKKNDKASLPPTSPPPASPPPPACTPNCSGGRNCGSNGCDGGSCGSCSGTETCGGGGTAGVCGGGTPACGTCATGQRCDGGTCVCDAQSCPGCCDGHTCRGGDSNTTCGSDGGVCRVCGSSQTCNGGACLATVTCPANGTYCTWLEGQASRCGTIIGSDGQLSCFCAERADGTGNVCWAGGQWCSGTEPICQTDADCSDGPHSLPSRCIKAGECGGACLETVCVAACVA